jgi:predicted DNA-binding protein with PD1-like motif
MRSKLLNEDRERTYALVFDKDDEVMGELERFARDNRITAAHFTAIGAFSRVVLGYFDWERKDYERIEVAEQVEVLSLVGDVALQDGVPKVHAHVVLGRRDGSACGGHLLEARVRPTVELILSEPPNSMRREHDPETGLALIRLDA